MASFHGRDDTDTMGMATIGEDYSILPKNESGLSVFPYLTTKIKNSPQQAYKQIEDVIMSTTVSRAYKYQLLTCLFVGIDRPDQV